MKENQKKYKQFMIEEQIIFTQFLKENQKMKIVNHQDLVSNLRKKIKITN